MILWLIFAALTLLVVAALIYPLLRRPQGPEAEVQPGAEDLAVYRDQLQEVGRDQNRGLLDEEQAAAARLEIERRLLRAGERMDRLAESAKASRPRASARMARGPLPLILAVALPLTALGSYFLLGSPGTPSQPYAERVSADGATPRGDLKTLADNLAGRLASGGGDAQDWILLARTYAQLDRYPEAAEASRRAIELGQADAENYGFLGEMLVAGAEGDVPQPARDAFAKVLELDRGNPRALYYAGLALAQDGQLQRAYEVWVGLAHSSPAEAPWMGLLTQQIARVAADLGIEPPASIAQGQMPGQSPGQMPGQTPAEGGSAPRGPSAADMAAAQDMTPEERMGFIRQMVEGLAQRLEDKPDDLEGWLRLIRAYQVLGEPEKAAEALKKAEPLAADLPEDAPQRQALEAARQALAAGG